MDVPGDRVHGVEVIELTEELPKDAQQEEDPFIRNGKVLVANLGIAEPLRGATRRGIRSPRQHQQLGAGGSRDRDSAGLALLANEQLAGRGQFGRSWQAPAGSSVLVSVVLFPPQPLCRPALLTAWAAVSVCNLIEEITGLKARIKWPNDVLVHGKKVCGILIEHAPPVLLPRIPMRAILLRSRPWPASDSTWAKRQAFLHVHNCRRRARSQLYRAIIRQRRSGKTSSEPVGCPLCRPGSRRNCRGSSLHGAIGLDFWAVLLKFIWATHSRKEHCLKLPSLDWCWRLRTVRGCTCSRNCADILKDNSRPGSPS